MVLPLTKRVARLGVLLALGAAPAGAQQSPAPAVEYRQREVAAAPEIKLRLEALREQGRARGHTFQVGYTNALDRRLEQLAGLVPPPNLPDRITAQRIIGVRARDQKMAEVLAKVCSATAGKFDWRQNKGTTPVRDQGGCGSCWAFTTHGAFEGAYRITASQTIDSAEQDTLDCNPDGFSCAGGWWAFQYLVDTGTAKEADYPYTATKGTCRTVKRPYKAKAWAYVGTSAIPSVAEMKQALCSYGPLAIAVQVTSPFVAYTSGVFNACAQAWRPAAAYAVGDLVVHAPGTDIFACTTAGTSGAAEPAWPTPTNAVPHPTVNDGSVVWQHSGVVNHGITLVGWDDAKQAWLIKNSWGTTWGETAGYGSEQGYMWLAYGCNNAGLGAAWVQAKGPDNCH